MGDLLKNNINDDEIDLYEVFLILKKHIYLIASFSIIFLIISSLYLYFSEKIYVVENYFVIPEINNNVFNQKDIIALVESITKQNKDFYTTKLKMTNDEIKGLKKITINEVKGGKNIRIILELINPKLADSVFQKILSYINNSDYYIKIIEQNRQILNKEKLLYENNIKIYKTIINKFTIDNQSTKENFLGFDPVQSLIESERKLYLIDEKLKYFDTFYKISYAKETIIPDKPSKPKPILVLTVSIISGLMLGTFISFFKEWIDNRSSIKEQQDKL